MNNAILSAIFVFGAVYMSKRNPVLAGLLAVFPIKIIVTLIATELQRDVIFSMMLGQSFVLIMLVVLWGVL